MTIFKSRRQLVENITHDTKPYLIRPDGKEESIEDIVNKHLYKFAELQYEDLNKTWNQVMDLDEIYNVGGSSILIKEHLIWINKAKNNLPINFLNEEESIWSIAKAYFKILHIVAQQKGLIKVGE